MAAWLAFVLMENARCSGTPSQNSVYTKLTSVLNATCAPWVSGWQQQLPITWNAETSRTNSNNCQLFKLLMPNFLIIDLTATNLEALGYFSSGWFGRNPDWTQLASLIPLWVKCLLPISSSSSRAGGGSSSVQCLDACESAGIEKNKV